VRVLLANLSSILGAAVEDGLIPSSPCQARSVKAPPVERKRVVPWSGDRVEAVVAEHPERFRAMPMVAAGVGLRQGEVFGLAVDDVVKTSRVAVGDGAGGVDELNGPSRLEQEPVGPGVQRLEQVAHLGCITSETTRGIVVT
jgi:integrase